MPKLFDLQPKTPQRVIDLVDAAGVDVSDWASFKGGKAKAAVNPKYCYEWAFIEPHKLVVLSLWFESMKERNGVIEQDLHPRQSAQRYEGLQGKTVWKTRALRMDHAIQVAAREHLPVRVIVCDGKMRNRDDPDSEASKVTMRMLDPVPWAVTAYDQNTGNCTVTRGASADGYVDQFALLSEAGAHPDRRTISRDVFERDPAIQREALLRAKGKCEWCQRPGFAMPDGRVFLETHHIVPLAEGGPDSVTNVAALCPNHHREAHYGAMKQEIRKKLLDRISNNSR